MTDDLKCTMDDNADHRDEDAIPSEAADREGPPAVTGAGDAPSPGTASTTDGGGRRSEPDELKCRLLELEIQQVMKENRRLRRCVGGVTALSRALTKANSEVAALRRQLRMTDVTLSDTDSWDTSGDKSDWSHVSSWCASTENGGAAIPEANQEDCYSADMDISLPPQDTENSPEHPDELPDGISGEPPDESESKQGFSKEELRPAKPEEGKGGRESHSEVRPTEGQKTGESEGSDHGCKTSGAPDSPSEGDVEEKQGDEATDRAEDRGDAPGARQQPPGRNTTPVPGDLYESETGDQDGSGGDVELATAEAMLTKLAVDVTLDGTPPGRDEVPASSVRSVATLTEEMGRFAGLVASKLEEANLQMQVQELKKANQGWKKYSDAKHQDYMADKKRLESLLEDSNVEAAKRAEHYDQMLLTAKGRIDETQEKCKELESELERERARNDKLEKLNRSLAKQSQSLTREVKDLKEALERKHKLSWKAYSPTPFVPFKKNVEAPAPVEPEREAAKPQQAAPKRPRSPPVVAEASVPLPLVSPTDEEEALSAGRTRPKSPPDRARGHGEVATALEVVLNDHHQAEKSLSKEQLKEQVELYRQQQELFESDFRKERIDKNKAIDKLNNFRREVKTQRHHQIKEKPKPREAPIGQPRGPPQPMGYVRRTASPPNFNHITSYRTIRGIQQKPVTAPVGRPGTRPQEVTVVKYGDNTTFRLVGNSAAVIMPTEPEGVRLLNLQLGGQSEAADPDPNMEPFQCPRCQRLFRGSEWESYEHHVTLCNM